MYRVVAVTTNCSLIPPNTAGELEAYLKTLDILSDRQFETKDAYVDTVVKGVLGIPGSLLPKEIQSVLNFEPILDPRGYVRYPLLTDAENKIQFVAFAFQTQLGVDTNLSTLIHDHLPIGAPVAELNRVLSVSVPWQISGNIQLREEYFCRSNDDAESKSVTYLSSVKRLSGEPTIDAVGSRPDAPGIIHRFVVDKKERDLAEQGVALLIHAYSTVVGPNRVCDYRELIQDDARLVEVVSRADRGYQIPEGRDFEFTKELMVSATDAAALRRAGQGDISRYTPA
jgi:hypothetical protein